MAATLTWHINATIEGGEYRLMHLENAPQGRRCAGD